MFFVSTHTYMCKHNTHTYVHLQTYVYVYTHTHTHTHAHTHAHTHTHIHWYRLVLLVMERAIQQTIDYTRERKAFGKSILDNQYVHFRLAEMESEVEALRSLIYRATGENLYIHVSLSVCN